MDAETSVPMRVVMPSQHALVVCSLVLSLASVSHLRWPRLASADALRQSADGVWDAWHWMSRGSSESGLVCPSMPRGGWTLGGSAA